MKKQYAIFGIAVLLSLQLACAGTVELFSKPDCGPCDSAEAYLLELQGEFDFNLRVYEQSQENGSDWAKYSQTAKSLGLDKSLWVVPLISSGNDYHLGFRGAQDKNILRTLTSKAAGEPNPPEDETVIIELFWGEGCPHCQDEKRFLAGLKEKYPEIEIREYEVNGNEEGLALLMSRASELNFSIPGVPVTVIGDWHLLGYGSDSVQGELIERVVLQKLGLENESEAIEKYDYLIDIPLIGIVDTREMGVPVSTVVIGLLDGFNPCAFFVLTMLLSFLLYAKSRKKMLLIGMTFIFISALVYFMAMVAIYIGLKSVGAAMGGAFSTDNILLTIGGAIALFIGLINIKDFFFFRKGISLTISEDKKPRLYKRMRGLLKSQSTFELLVATIVLAFVANSYELICTAAMPFVYDNLLLAQGFDDVTAFTYIAFYCIVYILPLLAIVLVFVKKFDGEKMDKETGEILKAISGFMMLGFGAFLILDPGILSNLGVIISIVAFAVAISLALNFIKSRYKGKPAKEIKEAKKSGNKQTEKKTKDGPAKKPEV
jgi:thiol-disulfide isomerase/thioredoxin